MRKFSDFNYKNESYKNKLIIQTSGQIYFVIILSFFYIVLMGEGAFIDPMVMEQTLTELNMVRDIQSQSRHLEKKKQTEII